MKKVVRKILIVFFLLTFIFSIGNIGKVIADTDAFKLTNVEIKEKSESVESTINSYDKNNINSNVIFHKLNDYIIYNLTIKNQDSKNYVIKTITDNNQNNYIVYEYDKHENETFSSNESKKLLVKITYKNEVNDISKRNNNDTVKLTITLIDENGNEVKENIIINPITGDSIYKYIILCVISLIGLFILNSKKYKNMLMLIVMLLLVPLVTKALSASFVINFNNSVKLYDKLLITFDDKGNKSLKDIPYNSKLTKPSDPVKEGYTFVGWYNGEEEYNFDSIVTKDVTLKAKYNLIEYTITYNLNGGIVSGNKEIYNVETDSFTLKNPSKEGYNFSGWTGSNGEVLQTSVTIEKGSIGNKTFTANYSEKTNTSYKVIHKYKKLDGTTKDETENLEGTTGSVVRPQVKSKTGFVNPSEQDLEIKADGSSVVTYIYEREKYTLNITDRTNLNSVSTSNGEYPYETKITLKANKKEGYTFKWSDNVTDYERTFNIDEDKELSLIYTPKEDTTYKVIHKKEKLDGTYSIDETENKTGTTDTEITPSVKTYEGFTSPSLKTETIKGDGTLEIEYLYTRNKYNLTVEDATNVEEDKSGEYKYETEVTLKANDKEGYTFAGWSNGESEKEITITIGTENITIKPLYTANNDTLYKVEHKYKKLDGTFDIEEESYTGTTNESVEAPLKSKTGFINPEVQNITITPNGNAKVTYIYEREKYTLNITDRTNLNSISTSNGEYPYETEITLKANEKEGYTFKWSDNVTDYERTFNIDEDKELSLIYTPNTYVVIFNKNNALATGNMENEEFTYDEDKELTENVFSLEGYTFDGWNTASDGTGLDYDDKAIVKNLVTNGEFNLYAKWIEIPVENPSITYHYGDIELIGGNYIDTKLQLFSSDYFNTSTNHYRDFDINFTLNNLIPLGGQSSNRNVIVSCFDELDKTNYIGFDFRYLNDSNKKFELATNSNRTITDNGTIPSNTKLKKYYGTLAETSFPWNINLKREGTILSFNDDPNMDYVSLAKNNNITLTFGAETQNATSVYRFSKGSLSNISTTITYDKDENITLPVPTQTGYNFVEWNTKADGTGESYTSLNVSNSVDLYAIWEKMDVDGYNVTYNYGDINLDGNNYLNTNIKLYSNDMYLNDFEVSTKVSNFEFLEDQDGNYNAVISSMNEKDTTYPGFIYRYNKQNKNAYELVSSSSSTNKITINNPSNNPISIRRTDSKLYVNNQEKLNYIDFNKYFNIPLIFGSELDTSGNPFRFFKGDLLNTTVKVEYAKGKNVTLPTPVIENSGCEFKGWTGSNGSTPEKKVTISSSNIEDKTYTANFDCSGYSILFEYNGGDSSEESRTIDKTNALGDLPETSKTGYTFDGWYLESTYETKIDSTYVPTSNITLYAKWNPNTYEVIFDKNNESATGEMSNQSFNYDEEKELTENAFTYEGYIFTGWNTASDGSGNPYLDKENVSNLATSGNITLYAQWISETASNYKVTYNYGDYEFKGTNYLNTKLPLFSSENYNISTHDYKDFSVNFKVTDYNIGNNADSSMYADCTDETNSKYPGFVYRYRTSGTKVNFSVYVNGGTDKYTKDFSGSNIPENVKIERIDDYMYINDVKSTYSLDELVSNFDTPLLFGASIKSDGSIYRQSKSTLENVNVTLEYTNSKSVTLPEPEHINSQCAFEGWTGSNGSTPQKDVSIPAGNTSDKTYTAHFNCEPITVTFNPNGGTVSKKTTLVVEGSKIGTLPEPTREGYTFDGWYLEPILEHKIDENYIVNSNMTVYAKWNINSYTITFDSDGGSSVDSITQEYNTNITAPQVPTKEGYTFVRWNPDLPVKMPAKNQTLTAVWRSNDISEYTVTYDFNNLSFTGSEYLDTKLSLFSNDLLHNNFDISMEMANNEFNNKETMNSFVSCMDESGNPYPGFVFRYSNSSRLDFVSNSTATDKYTLQNYKKSNINIKREGAELYFDGNAVLDFSNLAKTFNTTLTIGSSLNNKNQPFRYYKGDLNNVKVKVNFSNEEDVTLIEPTMTDCEFNGWTINDSDTPSKTIIIPSGNTENKTYKANFTCSKVIVTFDPNGGNVSETRRKLEEDSTIGELPVPTRPGYLFDGWYLDLNSSSKIDSTYIPNGKITLYAKWKKTVESMTISNSEMNLTIGENNSISIENISEIGEEYTFTSNDNNIATVDSNGLVTGVSEGITYVTIKGLISNTSKRVDIYVNSDSKVKVFNVTSDAVKNYLENAANWNTSEENFLSSMQANFESNNCMMNSDSSVKYASGSVLCDKARSFDTGVNGKVNVYLYNAVDETKTNVNYTNSNSGKITNMIPGETYYWESAEDSSVNGYVKAIGKRRLLDTGVIRNTRDLGGLPVDIDNDGTIDGNLKYGIIFRGERLRNTQSDIDLLEELGVNKEIVLSGVSELGSDLKFKNGNSENYKVDTIVHYQIDYTKYKSNYDKARGAVTRAMQDVVNGKGIYFHCVYGSDRTGTLGYLLEGLLGVPDEDRYEDYELSTFFGEVDRTRYFKTDIKSTLPKFVYMKEIIPTTQSIYDWYMLGSTNQESDNNLINQFRSVMINYN